MTVISVVAIEEAAHLIQNQDYSGALTLLQSIQQSELVGAEFAQFCIEYTNAAIHTGDHDLSHIDAAIDFLQPEDSPDLLARAKMLKGLALFYLARFGDAVQHYLEASVLYRNTGDTEFTAICLNLLGWAHMRHGNYSASVQNYVESLQLIQTLRETTGEERLRLKERGIAHNLAYSNIQFGRLNEGLDGYMTYPLSREELSGSTAVNFHINHAQAYAHLKRTEEAREALKRCQPHLKGQAQEEALYWNGLGLISFNECDFVNALSNFKKAETSKQDTGNDLLAGIWRMQAECELALGQYQIAAKSARKAYDEAFRSREQLEIGCSHKILGSIAAHRDQQEIACNHFTQAIEIHERIDSQYELARTRQSSAYSGVFPVKQCHELVMQANNYFDREKIPRPSDRHTEEIMLGIALQQSSPSQLKRVAEIMATENPT